MLFTSPTIPLQGLGGLLLCFYTASLRHFTPNMELIFGSLRLFFQTDAPVYFFGNT